MKRLGITLATAAAAIFIGCGAAQATEPVQPDYYQLSTTSQQHGDTGFVYEYSRTNVKHTEGDGHDHQSDSENL